MNNLIDGTITDFDEGDLVNGTVVKIEHDEVLVDIGFKSEGVIPVRELSIRKDANPADIVALGDPIEALVLQKEDKDGRLVLSKKRAEYERAWNRIEEKFNSGENVEGEVIEVVKGGLILDIGLRGFLPASLVDLRRVKDLTSYMGTRIEARVIEMDRNRNNVVLSRRVVLEESRKAERSEILSKLKSGMRLQGTVSSIVDFGAFVVLFPQLIAGPIVRYQSIAEELEHRDHTPDLFAEGTRRFVCGLAKKILLANNIGLLWEVASAQAAPTMLTAWLGAITYGFQIYFDFSGYSDMAIGIGRVFGFHFDENFRHPFLCKDITEFWQRWHISLGTFFRDYVLYIPIFGKRRKYGGLFLVWFCTGLWHGASWNYIIWGLYYGCFVLFEQLMGKKRMRSIPIVLRHLYNKLVIIVGFGIFYFEDTKKLGIFLKTLFGFGGNGFSNAIVTTSFQNNVFLILLALICCFPLLKIPKAMMQKSPAMHITLSFAGTLCCVALLIISSILLVDATNKPFLYLRF